MSEGLSRRAAVLASAAIDARSAAARWPSAVIAGGCTVVSARVSSAAVAATAWPAHPIRPVVPSALGGVVAQGSGEPLGQPLAAENRPGAGAGSGNSRIAAAAPDGPVPAMPSVAGHAIAPAPNGDLRHDPVPDFGHIGFVSSYPSASVSHLGFAARGLRDVARLSVEAPRGPDVASSGAAVTDAVAGVAPPVSDSLPPAAGRIRAGPARAPGVSAAERRPAIPRPPAGRARGIRPLRSGAPGVARAGFRRDRRTDGAAAHDIATARAPAGRARAATKPRRIAE